MDAQESSDDDDDDDSEGDAEINAIYRLELSEETRTAYQSRIRHFVAYLRRTDPDLVLSDDAFDVQRLHIRQFQFFLLVKQDIDQVSFSALENYRTALVFAFHEAKVTMPLHWPKKLKRFYRGLRRKEAQEIQDGKRSLGSQRQAMPHRVLVWLCEYFIHQGNIFAWAYLTLAWSSMARTSSVANIHLGHLEPLQDSLGLHVPKSKADQGGLRAKIAWAIFANPGDFRQCPITALAALLLLDELRSTGDEKLFMGSNQERRFARALEAALGSESGKALMREVGRAPGSIVPHSSRKGSAAFASGGTTHASSFLATTLRGGWSLGDVLGRYFSYDFAMDALLGRILVGLDISSVSFASLPPHFKHDMVPDTVLLRCFPAYRSRPQFLGVLRFVLPSLVHHRQSLLALLPKKHPIHVSVLFTDAQLSQSLSAALVTGLDSPYMRASGVPPHVTLLRQGASIEAKIDELIVRSNPNKDDEKADETTDMEEEEEAVAVSPSLHKVPFPLDFTLPVVGPLAAWRLLLKGMNQTPPYRLLTAKDFPSNPKIGKRISEWRMFFNAMLANLGDLVNEQTLQQLALDPDEQRLNELFDKGWALLDFGETKTKVRPDQWKITTVVNKLRAMRRPKPALVPVEVVELLDAVRPRGPRTEETRKKVVTVDYKQFMY